jgi:ribonuclease-3
MHDLSGLERALNYQFKDRQLLLLALTHRSHSARNNERLEFLGDGVLNFLIAHMIFQSFADIDEGEMSRIRAQLVKESTLGEIAHEMNLGDFLRLGEGELKSAGWRRPSVLADALEAIFAAVFLDAGYPAANQLAHTLFQHRLANVNPKAIGKDAKTMLQELLQARKLDLPNYQIVRTEGEAHQQTFFVECRIEKLAIFTQGHGSSRRNAEQMSAEQALPLAQQQLAQKSSKAPASNPSQAPKG